jgi:hypothetical protein
MVPIEKIPLKMVDLTVQLKSAFGYPVGEPSCGCAEKPRMAEIIVKAIETEHKRMVGAGKPKIPHDSAPRQNICTQSAGSNRYRLNCPAVRQIAKIPQPSRFMHNTASIGQIAS